MDEDIEAMEVTPSHYPLITTNYNVGHGDNVSQDEKDGILCGMVDDMNG